VSAPLHADLGKEFVPRSAAHPTGTSWVLKKCRILVLGAWLARRTHGLDPVDALEGHARILFAAELYRRRPITGRREEEAPEYVPSSFSFLNPSLVFARSALVAKIRPSPVSIGCLVFLSITTTRCSGGTRLWSTPTSFA